MLNPYSEISDININPATSAQKALKDALIQLLCDSRLDKISVKELCAHAFVARSTFYVYYSDIDEVLQDIENDMLYKLVRMNTQLMDRSLCEPEEMFFYSETLTLLKENQTAFYALLVSNTDYRFIEQWKKAMKYHLWERIKPPDTAKNIELVLEIAASSAIGAYTFWLTHPYEVDIDGTSKILSGILKGIDFMT